MKRILTVLLLTLVSVYGCGKNDSPVDTGKPGPGAPDESVVVASCDTLKAAVERFAAENDGVYPDDVDADTSLAGNTLLDLLPAGGLANPFTKMKEPPVNGAADSPGEVGYVPVAESEWNVGYVITGFGAEKLVATLSNLASPEEAKVIANCYILKQGAEAGHDPYIGYAYEIDAHPYYHIWLPHALVDPYTGLNQLPLARTASSRGEIGYVVIVRDGIAVGYIITGYGDDSVICALSNLDYSPEQAIVASDARTLQRKVEKEAEELGGVFPDAEACLPAVRYETIRLNGWNVGYKIVGSAQGVDFLEIATPEEEAKTRMNCLVVKQAVEAFAAASGGVYPETVDMDRIFGGKNVLDLMPREHTLENPYTGLREDPVNHSASTQGEVGYAMIPEYHGDRDVPPGYVITGFVNDTKWIAVTNLKVSTIEAVVMSHCRTLQLAVEEFAAHREGVYPSDVDSDYDNEGKSVTDYLPRGVFLLNPVTWACTEPVDGWAATPGEIGYVPWSADGINQGYGITGTGIVPGQTIMLISRDLEDVLGH